MNNTLFGSVAIVYHGLEWIIFISFQMNGCLAGKILSLLYDDVTV